MRNPERKNTEKLPSYLQSKLSLSSSMSAKQKSPFKNSHLKNISNSLIQSSEDENYTENIYENVNYSKKPMINDLKIYTKYSQRKELVLSKQTEKEKSKSKKSTSKLN